MSLDPAPICPKCGALMTYGASHTGPGLQAECWSCGYVEQVVETHR